MGYSKPLFLINNQQPQIAKADIFGKQGVRSDDNIYCSICQAFLGIFGLFCGYKP